MTYEKAFDNKYTYTGNDLGANYQPTNTRFRLWAPTAVGVTLCLYEAGDGDCLKHILAMEADQNGTWVCHVSGDLNHTYYTYRLTFDPKAAEIETVDPYARAVGVNGRRAMVVDLRETDPEGFAKDRGPMLESYVDASICEISVADTTADASCGAIHPGKFIGLIERGTRNKANEPTGFDHLLDLGVTHVQIMPVYDFASIDETYIKKEADQTVDIPYNWGYDPLNYNVPEGSFSTDPYHGEVRIREFKQMVQGFHQAGIGVIMDVVYNHVNSIDHSCFQKTVPDYFFRKDGEVYSDASACGNEIASDRAMVRRYIVDSVCYWAREYHIDGFRFDLMGVLDIKTMQMVRDELKKINPNIIVYGEGWTGGSSVLPESEQALKKNIFGLEGVGAFSDDIRDTLKGHVFYQKDCGFVNGAPGMENALRYAVVGATNHPQVNYRDYGYTECGAWAKDPVDTVNYVSCHDNLTLWDKLRITGPKSFKLRKAMNNLCAAIIFTAQGIPFFLSGEEFLRSKPVDEAGTQVSENSYNLPLFTNSLKYDRMSEYLDVCNYYKGLIAFRKAHKELRLRTAQEVREQLHFLDNTPDNVVAYTIQGEREQLYICYNGNRKAVRLPLPDKEHWTVYIDKRHAGTEPVETVRRRVKVAKLSCVVAVRNESCDPASDQ